MRPFVWGGLLLAIVVSVVFSTRVVTKVRQHGEPAVIAHGTGPVFSEVVTTNRGKTVVTTRSNRKERPPQFDPKRVLTQWHIQGEFRLSDNDAWDSALQSASNQLRHDLDLTTTPARDYIRERLMSNWEEERKTKFIDNDDAIRISLDLELTEGVYKELIAKERGVRVRERMEGLVRLLGILVAALGTVAGYIRLDELTKGYYTGRLRLVAIALIAVATAVITRV